jgi:uncharacterized membrane protein YbhN (UPF0104 family)
MAFSILLSVVVLLLIATQVDLRAVFDVLRRAVLPWLLLSLIVYLLSYVLRTVRIAWLLEPRRFSAPALFSAVGLYGVFVYLMPARTGEATLPVLLKARMNVPLAESTAALLVARFFDFLSVTLSLPFVLLALRQRLPIEVVYTSIGFLVVMALAAGVYFLWLGRRSISADESGAATGLWARAVRWLRQLLVQLGRQARNGGQVRLLLISLAVWLCIYLDFYLIAGALGQWLEFAQIIVLAALLVPLTVSPLQGVAGLGAYEAGWVLAFAIFGQPTAQGLLLAVGSHAVLVVFTLLLALLCWGMQWAWKQ